MSLLPEVDHLTARSLVDQAVRINREQCKKANQEARERELIDSGILAAMTAEAERLAPLDPRFSERTRERLRHLLST